MLPPRKGKKLHEFKYEGDPDLQPIRSNELAFLVRMLYYLCCWINYNVMDAYFNYIMGRMNKKRANAHEHEHRIQAFAQEQMYKEQLGELYMRDDLVGGIVRQVLFGPQDIYFYDRSQRGMSPRVSDSLPPRLSLRWFADMHLIGYSTLILLLMKFSVGYSFLTVIVFILFLWIMYMTIMSLLGLAPKKPILSVHDISENNQDTSFM